MSTKKKVIAVVEDDSDLRRDLMEAIADEGVYDVVGFENGIEIISWMAKNPTPAVIISDYLMPRMNGADLARAVHKAGISVIIITGCHDEAHKALQDMNLKQVPVIRKPMCIYALLEVIDKFTGTVLAPPEAESISGIKTA